MKAAPGLHGQRFVLTALGGAIGLLAAELYQTTKVLQSLKSEGVVVTLDLPAPFGGIRETLKPSSGSSSSSSSTSIEFPKDVDQRIARMHKVAAGVGVAAAVITFLVTRD